MDNLTPKPDDSDEEIAANAKPGGDIFQIDDDAEIEDTPDGGAIIRLDEEPKEGEGEFYANLADTLPASALDTIATELLTLIERDKEARKRRDEKYEEGIKRTGLGDEAPGGASFDGASKVVHPMLTEACIDFAARAIKELFPPGGPVKTHIPGDKTPSRDLLKKAERKAAHMNWQLTKQMPEFRGELEQLLTQVPLGGAQYLKLSWDGGRKRPVPLFVAIDDVLLPYAATSFESAERKTHVQYLTQLAFERKVANGEFVDVDLPKAAMVPESSLAQQANDRIEGREATAYNEDGLRKVYEVACLWEIEEDERANGVAPYLITIDDSTNKVLAVYRNWEEDDATLTEMAWMIEFPFVPWRGAYPIGLPHIIGGLSGAATGALRALLDSAHIANFPGMMKLKGGAGGQTASVQPTEVREIEGGFATDDIRKLLMPVPVSPPSPVLFQLLGFLIDAGRGVVRTTLEDMADGNPNVPVGTTLARMEQGMVVFSAIHARLHFAMTRVLSVLQRLNRMYLDDGDTERAVGRPIAKREDYDQPDDVEPVSDPNIFSEAQRFAQVQAVAQRAQLLPQIYNLRKVEEMVLERMKLPNAKELLLPEQQPNETNAANENVAASMGAPITAFPLQDHLAHIQAHIDFMRSPVLGQNPLIAPKFLPVMLEHIREHMALWYVTHLYDSASEAAGFGLEEAQRQKDPETKKQLDRLIAAASPTITEDAQKVFAGLMPILQEAQQLAQQFASQMPQPMDPTQAAMAEVQRKTAADQQKAQLDQQKAQIEMAREQREAQESQQRAAIEQQRLAQDAQQHAEREQGDTERTRYQTDARVGMNEADNQTARDLAQMEIAHGERIAVSTGTGINPQP